MSRWLCPHVTSRIVASVTGGQGEISEVLELEFCEYLGSEDVDEILNEWLLLSNCFFQSRGCRNNMSNSS